MLEALACDSWFRGSNLQVVCLGMESDLQQVVASIVGSQLWCCQNPQVASLVLNSFPGCNSQILFGLTCVPGSKLPLVPYNRGWSSTQCRGLYTRYKDSYQRWDDHPQYSDF